ncbi:MAG: PAS domain S-box protein [Acidobacteria bacterium]|nr:PAS domain S-box protein [Acidobacteriota bacterium]
MLKIEREQKRLQSLDQMKLTPAGPGGDFDLREVILNSPAEFLEEIHQKLFLIGKDILVSEESGLKADLLGVDPEGRSVIIAVHDPARPAGFLPAISAAAIIAGWGVDDFLQRVSKKQAADLQRHLSVDFNQLNSAQRVILVAGEFDFDSLTAMEWLNAGGIDILCISVAGANTFKTDADYLWCTAVSTKAAAHEAILLRNGSEGLHVSKAGDEPLDESLNQRLATEVDERRRTEEALRASEERFWTLAQLSPVGIFQTDGEGNFLYVNERWCEIAGLEQPDALGQGWARGMHPDDRDRVLTEWQEATDHAVPFKAEFRFQRTDSGTSWVLGEAAVQRSDAGKVTGYVGTVTELHRVDGVRNRSQMVGQSR